MLIYRSGYNVLANMSLRQKLQSCRYISRYGPLVKASSTHNCFCASSTLCAENVILESLRVARVSNIVIFCYEMKCPVGTLAKFDQIMTRGLHRQINTGTNVETSAIPLFCTSRGSTFEMVFLAGGGSGSANVELVNEQHEGEEQKVTACIYPRVMHAVKATYRGGLHPPMHDLHHFQYQPI
jgi:hypothetical protein